MNDAACSIEDCEKQAHCRGWCPMHYQRWRRYGDTKTKRPAQNYLTRHIGVDACTVPGCDLLQRARGLCNPHWKRQRRSELDAGERACPDCGITKPLAAFPPLATRRCSDCGVRHRSNGVRKTPQRSVTAPTEVSACGNCGEAFQANGRRRSYCSPACSVAARCERQKKHVQIRRARKLRAQVEDFHKGEIFERDGWVCGICAEPIERGLAWPDPRSVSLDHIVPLSRGGAHSRSNSQASHLFCNMSKHNRAAQSVPNMAGGG